MIRKQRYILALLLHSFVLSWAHEGRSTAELALPKDKSKSRIRVNGALQNAIRNAYRTSSRFRTMYDRLKEEPRLELVIAPHTRQLNQCRSDMTVVRIAFDAEGGIRHLKAEVYINTGCARTKTQRIGHELAHLEEILERQMAPSKIAEEFPDLAFPVKGWLSHYETHYAIDAEMEIAEQHKNGKDDLCPDQLENVDLFQATSSKREQVRRKKYFKKLRE